MPVFENRLTSAIRRALRPPPKSVQQLVATVTAALKPLVGFDLACIALVTGDAEPRLVIEHFVTGPGVARASVQWGPGARLLKIGGRTLPRSDRSFVGYTAFQGRSQILRDVTRTPFYLATKADIRSEIAVPVKFERKLLAIINLESVRPAAYGPQHQRALEAVARLIADQLAGLMRGPRLVSALPAAMSRIADLIEQVPPGFALDAPQVLNGVARVIANTLDSRRCAIWLRDSSGDALEMRGAWGHPRGVIDQARQPAGETPAWYAIR